MKEAGADLRPQNHDEPLLVNPHGPTVTRVPPVCTLDDGATLLQQRQRRRGEFLGAYFDGLAEHWDSYRNRNAYYHRTQRALLRTYVPQGMSVLEIGCATGACWPSCGPRSGWVSTFRRAWSRRRATNNPISNSGKRTRSSSTPTRGATAARFN